MTENTSAEEAIAAALARYYKALVDQGLPKELIEKIVSDYAVTVTAAVAQQLTIRSGAYHAPQAKN